MTKRYFVCAIVLCLFSGAACVEQAAAQTQQPSSDPPGTIDGAKTPEAIPDSVAYRLFFKAVSEPAQATPEQAERQTAVLSRIGLTDEDLAGCRSALASFHARHADWLARYTEQVELSRSQNVRMNHDPFNVEMETIVADTLSELQARLGEATMARFQKHVQSEKVRMKMVPFPSM